MFSDELAGAVLVQADSGRPAATQWGILTIFGALKIQILFKFCVDFLKIVLLIIQMLAPKVMILPIVR